MGNAEVRRGWRWTWSCDQQQNPSSNSSSRSYCFYLCLQSQVNKGAPPFTENGRAPSLPQNRLCRERTQNRSSINYSPSEIFISPSYLQTLLTITRVLQPIPHSCSRHGDSQNHVLNLFYSCSLYMDILSSYPSSRSKMLVKASIYSWLGCFFCLFFTLLSLMQGCMSLFNCNTFYLHTS